MAVNETLYQASNHPLSAEYTQGACILVVFDRFPKKGLDVMLSCFRASVPAFFSHGFAGPFSLGSGLWIATGPSTKITHSLYFIVLIANTY